MDTFLKNIRNNSKINVFEIIEIPEVSIQSIMLCIYYSERSGSTYFNISKTITKKGYSIEQ